MENTRWMECEEELVKAFKVWEHFEDENRYIANVVYTHIDNGTDAVYYIKLKKNKKKTWSDRISDCWMWIIVKEFCVKFFLVERKQLPISISNNENGRAGIGSTIFFISLGGKLPLCALLVFS